MNRAILVFALLTISLGIATASTALAQEGEARVPIEGLDPVELVKGKEVIGKVNISVTRGAYKYLFASDENRRLFEQTPERYAIQLGGSCARMGPTVGGNPDIYAVHNGRIYVFGSGECYKLFTATPEKYLEPETAPISGTPEALDKARLLLEKAVTAMGGAARIDSIDSYQERGIAVARIGQVTAEHKTSTTRVFPGRVHHEEIRQFGTVTDVLSPEDSFTVFRRQGGTEANVRTMTPVRREATERVFSRDPLQVLRARRHPAFNAVALGEVRIGERPTEFVAVEFGGTRLDLGIEPESGRILSMSYVGRDRSSGEVGKIAWFFSDFRTVDGLTLPFKRTGEFNGNPDPLQGYVIEDVSINKRVDPAKFNRPQ